VYTLCYIVKRDIGVSPGEISNEMGVSTARIAATLNSLEKKGFITRKIDTSNRRHIIVESTELGKEWATKNYNKAIVGCANMLKLLGEHDAQEFVRILGRFAELSTETNRT
jgi:DNA-binding MarR family transcriptional regulator